LRHTSEGLSACPPNTRILRGEQPGRTTWSCGFPVKKKWKKTFNSKQISYPVRNLYQYSIFLFSLECRQLHMKVKKIKNDKQAR
jgi:hypothetical protein